MLFKVCVLPLLAVVVPLACSAAEAHQSRLPRASGFASWYGPGFGGHRTASGERFDVRAFTAAHRWLPFGSRIRVTSNRTGRSIVVRINDRGPFVAGRIIDLSPAASRALGMGGTEAVTLAAL